MLAPRTPHVTVRSLLRHLLVLVLVAGVFVGGWWAGRTALDPPRDPFVAPSTMEYSVTAGAVEESFPMTAVASWPVRFTITSPASGVVTTVAAPDGGPVAEGDAPLTVDLRAVYLAQGDVPMFRDLARGTRGPDVEQLQQFLAGAGHFDGKVTGTYGSETTAAVRDWQRANGIAKPTGVVSATDLVFVPTLPVTVRPMVEVGDRVGAGDVLYEVLAAEPVFTGQVTQEQLALLTPAVSVVVEGPDGASWIARPGARDRSDPNIVAVMLQGSEGGSVCGDSCSSLPVEDASRWPARAVTVPRQEGPQVPVGAIHTRPDASTYVVMADGSERDVDVLGAAQGLAVVDGVDVGEEIVIPKAEK